MENASLFEQEVGNSWNDFTHIRQAKILQTLGSTCNTEEKEEYYNLALEHLDVAIKVQRERDGDTEVNSRNLDPYMKKVEILKDMDRYEEALSCLDEFIERNPKDDIFQEVKDMKVDLYLEMGQPERAAEWY